MKNSRSFIGSDGKPYGIGDRVTIDPADKLALQGARAGRVTSHRNGRVYVLLESVVATPINSLPARFARCP